MIKKTFFGILAMLALVCAGSWYYIHQNQAQTVKAEARKTYIQSSRPTIFFHGWGSSSRAERHMANAAKKAGVTQTIIEAIRPEAAEQVPWLRGCRQTMQAAASPTSCVPWRNT